VFIVGIQTLAVNSSSMNSHINLIKEKGAKLLPIYRFWEGGRRGGGGGRSVRGLSTFISEDIINVNYGGGAVIIIKFDELVCLTLK
jgi:hypothetical protein